MRKLLSLFFSLAALTAIVSAQAPNSIPYQGVARNVSGNILASQPISLRISIHNLTTAGTVLYKETHAVNTSSLGLFNVNIGTGTPVTGTLSTVDWSSGAIFIQVEMDATGGATYIDMGTTQLMSVPYALYANNGIPAGTITGQMLYWNGSAWIAIPPPGSNGQFLCSCAGVPQWGQCYLPGSPYQGGIIAYILQPGDIGYDPNIIHGMIAAPYDQSTGIRWDNGTYVTTNASGTAIGTGNANTTLIVNAQGTGSYAAKLCYDLVLNGYSDWYLPSIEELHQLYLNRIVIGGFAIAQYWSSSVYPGAALDYVFVGYANPDLTSSTFHVRAIRSF